MKYWRFFQPIAPLFIILSFWGLLGLFEKIEMLLDLNVYMKFVGEKKAENKIISTLEEMWARINEIRVRIGITFDSLIKLIFTIIIIYLHLSINFLQF